MPELPEVETVARGLQPFAGRRLLDLEIIDKKVWFESEAETVSLRKVLLSEVSRRGKYLLLRFENGLTLVQHLRMTGKMLEADSPLVPLEVRESVSSKKGKGLQVRCRFLFDEGEIWFFDTRRFGTLTLIKNEEKFFTAKGIAPDPIQEESRAREWYLQRLSSSSKPAKAALLDQMIVAGVGNIYADEALHAAGIHPRTRAQKIKDPMLLWEHILRLLHRSIEMGGSTIRDYVSAEGAEGKFADLLLVYDRKGEACATCKKPIQRIVLAGRSTHFCANCQPLRSGKSTAGRAKRSPGRKKPKKN